MNFKILLVDDDENALEATRRILEREGHSTILARSAIEALQEIAKGESFDLMITDVRMPEISGIELVRRVLAIKPDLPFLVMTAYGRVEEAVWAMKVGAVDFLEKPFKRQELLEALKRMKPKAKPKKEAKIIRGHSRISQKLWLEVEQIAVAEVPVLILGESGSGKEMVAQEIHAKSKRANAPLIAINCAAIPENLIESELFGFEKGAFTGANQTRAGLFEAAQGGTLFLDEVGDLPLELQPKLLRVLETKKIRRLGSTEEITLDVRVISATHRPLRDQIQDGRFRADLFYRLEVLTIEVPPLRDRKEDIVEFVDHWILEKTFETGIDYQLSLEAKEAILKHSWPGNLRELKNALERACALSESGAVNIEHLPASVTRISASTSGLVLPEGISLREAEGLLFQEALTKAQGDRAKAAKILGVNERTIYRWLNRGVKSNSTPSNEC